jgi:RNA polymerase sigma factor (sigma-70 family)
VSKRVATAPPSETGAVRDEGRASDAGSDEALMRAYVAGDESAFREIFARYAPRIFRVVRRQVVSTDDASDIVQQTFLQLHRARADFEDGARLRPWLFTIALNLKREHFRRRGRRPESALELDGRSDPSTGPADLEKDERSRLLRTALAQLPQNQREVIELHWFEELPMAEIATIVGASVSAVKVRAHRGYEKLRGLVEAMERNHEGLRDIPGGDER